MRSHLENIVDLCINNQTQKLVSVGMDHCLKIWNAETMELQNEFVTQNDLALKVISSHTDPFVAVGFQSGFLRIFDL